MRALAWLEKYILLATLFLVPTLVLPIFPNPYDTAKLTVLAAGIGLVVAIKAVRTVNEGSFEFGKGTYDLPLCLLSLAYFVAAIIKTPNKMDAFFLPGTASFLIGSVLIFFLLNSLGSKEKRAVASTLFFSGVAASLLNLLAFSRIFAKIPQLPAFMKDAAFTPLGGALPAAVFLTTLLLIGVGLTLTEKQAANKAFYGVSLIIVALGAVFSIYNALPGKATSPTLPPFGPSWSVAIETLKESPIFGIGPGNYVTAFNRFRPVTYNGTSLWAIRFTSGADFPLTALTETGLLGLTALALFYLVIVRSASKQLSSLGKESNLEENLNLAALVLVATLALVFPASPTFFLLLAALASLAGKISKESINLSAHSISESGLAYRNRLAAYLVAIPAILAVAALFFFGFKAVSAEATYNKALAALAQNDGKATYDYLRSAITINPYVDRYHATYAQVNLALAASVARQQNLTDTDRQTVSQLIQQAIREGKATVTLNPTRAGNWEILARTYQAIMAFAQGADNFAIQTFSQAVVLDPVNPNLRIALGGVYYALGRYDDAVSVFQLAALAKPDLANAHYNLAIAYREKGDYDNAIAEMNQVLSLVDQNSSDYNLAKTELDNLEKSKPVKTSESSQNLTPPTPSPTPAIKPPLELPQESTPPATTTP